MKRSILTLASVFLVAFSSNAQKVEFEEYDLNNGMPDKKTPLRRGGMDHDSRTITDDSWY